MRTDDTKTTPAMLERLRELATADDDFDRVVHLLLDDFETLQKRAAHSQERQQMLDDELARLRAENERLKSERDAELQDANYRLRAERQDNERAIARLWAENERLREALDGLLSCPTIADENSSDPEWGCAETAKAVSRARAALTGEAND